MCSVSWVVDETGYQVFFNRDEQKSRALALPPVQVCVNGIEVLMPIDPVGNGSWVSLNEFGLSLCLLNNYQGSIPVGTKMSIFSVMNGLISDSYKADGVYKGKSSAKSDSLISRGLLLKHLSGYSSVNQVENAFYQLNLNQFAPFTLLVFAPGLSSINSVGSMKSRVMAFEWNGRESAVYPTECPLFSSSVDVDVVKAYRLKQFHDITVTDKSIDALLKFHAHHHPEQMHLSTCMHREDAHTVSVTYLKVSKTHQSMAYIPGAPCTHLSKQALTQHQYQLCHKTSQVS